MIFIFFRCYFFLRQAPAWPLPLPNLLLLFHKNELFELPRVSDFWVGCFFGNKLVTSIFFRSARTSWNTSGGREGRGVIASVINSLRRGFSSTAILSLPTSQLTGVGSRDTHPSFHFWTFLQISCLFGQAAQCEAMRQLPGSKSPPPILTSTQRCIVPFCHPLLCICALCTIF